VAISGKKYYKDGVGLCFPTGEVIGGIYDRPNDGSYRSIYGFGVCFTRVVHPNNNLTLCKAFNGRNLVVRPGEAALRAAQTTYITTFMTSELCNLIRFHLEMDLETIDFMTDVIAHISDPHKKRVPRENALGEILSLGISEEDRWLRNECVTVNLKRLELAKYLKVGRIVIDLGCRASLQGYRLTHAMKDSFARTITVNNNDFEFLIKPSADGLQRVFDTLINPPRKSYFVFFSDDSCLAIRINGVVHRYNLDISKCDISHTPSIFKLLYFITPDFHKTNMKRLIDQCAADLQITAPERLTFGKLRVRLASANKEPRLLSGSTLTTLVNNLACYILGHALQDLTDPSKEGVEAAVLKTGYAITCTVCHQIEDLQFLKYSPILDLNGVYRPLLNIGVLLRATGTCHGDLPGRGDIPARAAKFQKLLLQGIAPTTHYPLIDMMKKTVAHVTPTAQEEAAIQRRIGEDYRPTTSKTHTHFTSYAIGKRYRLSEGQMDELTDLLGNARFGELVACEASRAILREDYGLLT